MRDWSVDVVDIQLEDVMWVRLVHKDFPYSVHCSLLLTSGWL